MSLDFNLHHLQQELSRPEDRIHVLVQFSGDVSTLLELGCEVTSEAGDVAAVFVTADRLEQLQMHPDVIYVEATRTLKDETDISSVAINLVDPSNGIRTIPFDGKGALIGFIDSGFDLTHPCFLDAAGETRIVAAWDQVVDSDNLAGEPPNGFGYGIEYKRETINAHVAAERVVIIRSQPGAGPHGTYVAGVAAGNGAPQGVYRGVAPGAELVLVAYRNDVPVGGSAYCLDAIDYIRKQAEASHRPVVINISQGDSLGAHDGTSLFERAIDNVVREGRVLVVISAGNERGGSVSHHARGEVAHGRTLTVPFELLPSAERPVDGDTIELWYARPDRIAVALEPPRGRASNFIEAGTSGEIVFPAGNRARVYSVEGHPTNGDNRIGIILEKGEGWEPGVWRLLLHGSRVSHGVFDAWADRPNTVTLIGFTEHGSSAATVTLPANAREAITVGGFISRPSGDPVNVELKGAIAPGSSLGPTRDGRVKPDLTAPGTNVMAPRLRLDACPPPYDLLGGTSIAAPHVTGVIALLWGLWPGLSARRLRDTLYATARDDSFTGATPNTCWGNGKLDAGAAYKALSTLMKKGAQTVTSRKGEVFQFETSPQPKRDGSEAGMSVRIEVRDRYNILITGMSEGERYDGILVLQKSEPEKLAGGDECYVNGVWKSPCPVKKP